MAFEEISLRRPSSYEYLATEYAKILINQPGSKIVVVGHQDDIFNNLFSSFVRQELRRQIGDESFAIEFDRDSIIFKRDALPSSTLIFENNPMQDRYPGTPLGLHWDDPSKKTK